MPLTKTGVTKMRCWRTGPHLQGEMRTQPRTARRPILRPCVPKTCKSNVPQEGEQGRPGDKIAEPLARTGRRPGFADSRCLSGGSRHRLTRHPVARPRLVRHKLGRDRLAEQLQQSGAIERLPLEQRRGHGLQLLAVFEQISPSPPDRPCPAAASPRGRSGRPFPGCNRGGPSPSSARGVNKSGRCTQWIRPTESLMP